MRRPLACSRSRSPRRRPWDPQSAIGPGGWDHVGTGVRRPPTPSLNGKVSALKHRGIRRALRGRRFHRRRWPRQRATGSPPGTAQHGALSARAALTNGEVKAIAYERRQGLRRWHLRQRWWQRRTPTISRCGTASAGRRSATRQRPRRSTTTSMPSRSIGSTLYVGGEFQNGAGIPTADYLLACDLDTGDSRSLFARRRRVQRTHLRPDRRHPGHPLRRRVTSTTWRSSRAPTTWPPTRAGLGMPSGRHRAAGRHRHRPQPHRRRHQGVRRHRRRQRCGDRPSRSRRALDRLRLERLSLERLSLERLGANTAGTNGWLPASATIYALRDLAGRSSLRRARS